MDVAAVENGKKYFLTFLIQYFIQVYRCGLNSDLARTCPYCGELLPSIRKVDKHVRM